MLQSKTTQIPALLFCVSFRFLSFDNQMNAYCCGLTKNGPYRLIGNGTVRCGLVGVGVVLMEDEVSEAQVRSNSSRALPLDPNVEL